ncbi:unnamed protein product [Acidithrix sp. C25]|nr:unnamed protein product [Acidithrix sp. C25]
MGSAQQDAELALNLRSHLDQSAKIDQAEANLVEVDRASFESTHRDHIYQRSKKNNVAPDFDNHFRIQKILVIQKIRGNEGRRNHLRVIGLALWKN